MSDRFSASQTRLIKPKTKRGRRILLAKAPKAIEDAKKALLLYGSTTSQIIKDVMVDLQKMKGLDVQKYTRKNRDIRPFEIGGEASLQFYASKSDCGLFVLGSHSKKRPHNITLGRLYDGQLYDAIELGVDQFRPIRAFGSACAPAQAGNKPCILFVGEKFESDPVLQQTKSMLLDFFRGQQIESINLAGLDRVIVAVAVDNKQILLRQYVIRLKRSGTSIPRVVLQEMGPRLNLALRRNRPAPVDLEREAMKQPKLGKKKEKNVGSDDIDGKVGRIYMPKQQLEELALSKPKGLRREHRESKRAQSDERKAAHLASGGAGTGGDERRAAAAASVLKPSKTKGKSLLGGVKRRVSSTGAGSVTGGGGGVKRRRKQLEAA